MSTFEDVFFKDVDDWRIFDNLSAAEKEQYWYTKMGSYPIFFLANRIRLKKEEQEIKDKFIVSSPSSEK